MTTGRLFWLVCNYLFVFPLLVVVFLLIFFRPSFSYFFNANITLPAKIINTAPAERAMAVGNVVMTKSAPFTIGLGELGTVTVPAFIAKAFEGGSTDTSPTDVDAIMALDDECYLGKDGNLDDCVDFDPPKLTP